MTNRILKSGTGGLILQFRYEPRILNVVREIDGRLFNSTKKQWEVPSESVVDAIDALKPYGFIISGDAKQLYEKKRAEREAILNIKSVPQEYTGTLPLYDFQKTGAAFLKTLPGALLADVPGLGKTLQTCAAYEDLPPSVLILVPASLKFNWHDEIKKWRPDDSVLVIHGNKKERTAQWADVARRKAKWIIANYELLIHDDDVMPSIDWQAVVCDEADRISNPRAKTTIAVKKIATKRRAALTGTPISNTPEDLWSIADWLYPRYLGSFSQFKDRYLKIHPEYGRVIGYKNLDQLRERIEPIMLRRKKEEVLKDFPPKTVEYVHFELSKNERDTYNAVRKLVIAEIKMLTNMDTRSLNLVPVKMLRLKQATNHLKLIDMKMPESVDSSKLNTLKEKLIPIIKSGEKAIVFTQFAQMAKLLEEELREHAPLSIWGGVDARERKVIADAFNEKEEHKILIMTEAGAYGLNLQRATYVFHYDAPWSVSKIEQREGRAHRVGQDKPVTVYHLIAKKTIDEYVLKVLKGKQDMSDRVLGDGAAILSAAEITEILEEEVVDVSVEIKDGE